jgi:hypothetical protein
VFHQLVRAAFNVVERDDASDPRFNVFFLN